MMLFCYGFGMAFSIALAVAIASAWVKEHRNGVWTPKMIANVAAAAVALGLTVGWSLVQYFTLIAASAAGRI